MKDFRAERHKSSFRSCRIPNVRKNHRQFKRASTPEARNRTQGMASPRILLPRLIGVVREKYLPGVSINDRLIAIMLLGKTLPGVDRSGKKVSCQNFEVAPISWLSTRTIRIATSYPWHGVACISRPKRASTRRRYTSYSPCNILLRVLRLYKNAGRFSHLAGNSLQESNASLSC